jgi:hypothetical protein
MRHPCQNIGVDIQHFDEEQSHHVGGGWHVKELSIHWRRGWCFVLGKGRAVSHLMIKCSFFYCSFRNDIPRYLGTFIAQAWIHQLVFLLFGTWGGETSTCSPRRQSLREISSAHERIWRLISRTRCNSVEESFCVHVQNPQAL